MKKFAGFVVRNALVVCWFGLMTPSLFGLVEPDRGDRIVLYGGLALIIAQLSLINAKLNRCVTFSVIPFNGNPFEVEMDDEGEEWKQGRRPDGSSVDE